MPIYFLLGTLTEHGQRILRNNPDLVVEAVREADCEGASILGQYAVLGKYDFVMMAQAVDNEAVARISLDLGVRIGLHIETLPAIAIGLLTEGNDGDVDSETEAAAALPDEWRLPEENP
ncbi:MAG: GYD domain-containing protein [Dehalococcoidia bacterium]